MMDYIKRHREVQIGLGIIVILLLAILILLIPNAPEKEKIPTEPTIIESNVNLIDEMTLSDVTNLEIQDQLVDIINSGISGEYTIGGRTVVILTTGGESSSDIEYTLKSDLDGNRIVEYKLGDTSDGEYKVRYKILEFDDTGIIVRKISNVIDYSTLTGAAEVIVFSIGSDKVIYDVANNTIIDGYETLEINGVYLAEFKDGKITQMIPKNTTEIVVTILSKVIQSNHLYNVKLQDGTTLTIYIDDLNLNENEQYTIKLSYDKSNSQFIGTVKSQGLSQEELNDIKQSVNIEEESNS